MTRAYLSMVALSAFLTASTVGTAIHKDPQTQTKQRQTIAVDFSESGIAQINTELVDGTPVEVSARTTRFTPETFPYTTSYPRYKWTGWGEDIGSPKNILTALDVKVGDKNVFVRLSAFADLADVHQLMFEDTTLMYHSTYQGTEHIDVDRTAFRLIIRGSDAGNSYTTELTFNSGYLERRSVWPGELPTRVSEVTVYRTP